MSCSDCERVKAAVADMRSSLKFVTQVLGPQREKCQCPGCQCEMEEAIAEAQAALDKTPMGQALLDRIKKLEAVAVLAETARMLGSCECNDCFYEARAPVPCTFRDLREALKDLEQ